MAYPWIFLVADDHGRFEYDPRAIWSRCFATREDVAVGDVARWLGEYEREELLFRYGTDDQFAYWYNFKGRKPSERRKSNYPDPPTLTPRGKGATRGRRSRDVPPPRREEAPPARDKPAPDIETDLDIDLDQIRSGNGLPPDAVAPGRPVDPVKQVFDHWRDVMPDRKTAQLTPNRRMKIKARLDEGYTASQLLEAIDGCRNSPFNMGDNDRHTAFNDLTLICRNGEKVEHYRLKRAGAAPIPPPARAGPMNPADRAGKWIADHGGTAIVARAVVEWADRERIEGETDQEASKRWASDVPDGSQVLAVLSAALYHERKRRDAVEAGRALPSGGGSA